MRCPFCGSQDIRTYSDKEQNLFWYLCLECKYQGYDARLLNENIGFETAVQSRTNQDTRITGNKL